MAGKGDIAEVPAHMYPRTKRPLLQHGRHLELIQSSVPPYLVDEEAGSEKLSDMSKATQQVVIFVVSLSTDWELKGLFKNLDFYFLSCLQ